MEKPTVEYQFGFNAGKNDSILFLYDGDRAKSLTPRHIHIMFVQMVILMGINCL